jgi:hypothetical protein
MKTRTGYIYRDGDGWIARITFTDASGRRRNVKRTAATRTEARRKLDKMRRQLEDHGERLIVDGERMTFGELADKYAAVKLVPARYVGEKKVAGLRSVIPPKIYLEVLKKHFGRRRLRLITHADIEEFKRERFDTPTRYSRQRAIASVNRELQLLNVILNWAVRQGWLLKNPFHLGPALILKSDENFRTRTLDYDEEERLLAACTEGAPISSQSSCWRLIQDSDEMNCSRSPGPTLILYQDE